MQSWRWYTGNGHRGTGNFLILNVLVDVKVSQLQSKFDLCWNHT